MVKDVLLLDVRDRPKVASAENEVTVFVHHGNDTPDHYMVRALQTAFGLSYELAEHITWVALETGSAPVVTRPRKEAERLVNKACIDARLYGFRLAFSLVEVGDERKDESRKGVNRLALTGLILLCALLLAMGLAVADGAGDFGARDIASQPKSGLICKEAGLPARVFGAPCSGAAKMKEIAAAELAPVMGAQSQREC